MKLYDYILNLIFIYVMWLCLLQYQFKSRNDYQNNSDCFAHLRFRIQKGKWKKNCNCKTALFFLMIDMISVCFYRVAIYSSIHRFFDGHQLEVQAFLSWTWTRNKSIFKENWVIIKPPCYKKMTFLSNKQFHGSPHFRTLSVKEIVDSCIYS